MTQRKTDEQKLDALIDAVGDSILEESDDEILEEMRTQGVDIHSESARLKEIMLGTVKAFRQRALVAARAAYDRQIENTATKQYFIPKTAPERRRLFAFITQQPQFAEFVTAQYRNLEDITDTDIETYLEDLAELDILQKLPPEDTNGKE
jgi:hypothetical protein